MENYIKGQLFQLSNQLLELQKDAAKVVEISQVCLDALQKGNKIIWCGNGGSAAQAQHLAAELVGRYKINRPAMNSVSLTVNTSTLTAIGNDYGYDVIFSRQLEGIGKKGDVLIGLSTSGASKNVLLAFEQARKMGIKTVALLGINGGITSGIADISLCVPGNTSAHIQEMHITVGHLICDLIEKGAYGKR